jgi:hypothetical protein
MYPDQISGRTQDKYQFACRPRSEAANLIYEICLTVVFTIQLRLRNLVISGRQYFELASSKPVNWLLGKIASLAYIICINDAKTDQTRQKRIDEVLEWIADQRRQRTTFRERGGHIWNNPPH